MTSNNRSQLNSPTGNIWQHKSLIASALSAIMIGLLLPLSGIVFDISVIFSLSLTAAILLIAVIAKNNGETAGFPSFVLIATLLQIALITAAVKLLFANGNTGSIAQLFDKTATLDKSIQAAGFLTLSLVSLSFLHIIYKKTKTVNAISVESISYIAPLKRVGIETLADNDFIDQNQVNELNTKVGQEIQFHFKTATTANFIIWCAIFEFSALTVGAFATKNHVMASALIGTAGQALALVSIAACMSLAKKNVQIPVETNTKTEKGRSKKIEVICNDVTYNDVDDTIYTNPAEADINEHMIETAFISQSSDESFIVENDSRLPLWQWDKEHSAEMISELIESACSGEQKTILMTSETIRDLPVTAPVEIGMKTAKKGLKCLLVDFDFVHNSISKTFGAAGSGQTGQPFETCIENLHIWSAADSSKNNVYEFKNSVKKFGYKYDSILIYAPAIKGRATKKHIATCVNKAMLFGNEKISANDALMRFEEILKSHDTKIIAPSCQKSEIIPAMSN